MQQNKITNYFLVCGSTSIYKLTMNADCTAASGNSGDSHIRLFEWERFLNVCRNAAQCWNLLYIYI